MSTTVRERAEIEAGPEASFEEGKFTIIQSGRHSIGITRLRGGEFRAVLNRCPHKGAPVCRGNVSGTWPPSRPMELSYDGEIQALTCPWHGFEYDLVEGGELYGTGPTRLRFFPVSVRDGVVFVTV
jgi:nitrite reductase (NADH) small subunit